MRTAGFVLPACAAADLAAPAVLLGAAWGAHRAVRREAAAEGEVVPSAARDFRCLFAILGAPAVGLGAASLLLLAV